MKRLWLLVLMFFCAAMMFAQTTSTTLTATGITDTDGMLWVNATFTITFVPSPSWPSPNSYVWSGGNLQQNLQFSGPMGATSAFSQLVPSTNAITPSGAQWKVTICPLATSGCININTQATGTTMDVTGQLNNVALGPRFTCPVACYGYNTIEVQPLPKAGAIFFNTSTNNQFTWNGFAWQSSTLPLNPTFDNITAQSVNRVYNASAFPGIDLGAKTNAALAALGGPGIVQINTATGSNFGCTTVTLGANQTLQFTQGNLYLIGGPTCAGSGGIVMSGNNAAITGPALNRSGGQVAPTSGQIVLQAANGAALASGVVQIVGPSVGDSVQNVVLDGNKANTGTASGAPVLSYSSASAVMLSYMTVQNSNGPGILISSTTPLNSDANKFDSVIVVDSAGAGIAASNTNDSLLYGSTEIENNGGNGIDCFNCAAWRLTGLDISQSVGDAIYSHTDATVVGTGGQWTILGLQERGNHGSCLHTDATAFFQNQTYIVMNMVCGIGGVTGANPLGGIQFSNSGRNYVSGILFSGGGTGQGQWQYDYWEGGSFATPSIVGSNMYVPASFSIANYLLLPGSTLIAGQDNDLPGSTIVKSVNTVAIANAFPGSDMGQKVNNALAFLNGPGVVQVDASTPGQNFGCTTVSLGLNQTLQFVQAGNFFFGGPTCAGTGGIILAGNNAAILGIGLVRTGGPSPPPNAQVTLIAGSNAGLTSGVVQLAGASGESVQDVIIDGNKSNSGTGPGSPTLYINKSGSALLAYVAVQNSNGPGISLVSTTANEAGSQKYNSIVVDGNAGAGIAASYTSDVAIYGASEITNNGGVGIDAYNALTWRLTNVDISNNGGDAIYSHSDATAPSGAGFWQISGMLEQANKGSCLHTDATANFQNTGYTVTGGLCNATSGNGTSQGINFSNTGRNVVSDVVFAGSPTGGQFVNDYFEAGTFSQPSAVGTNMYVPNAAATANLVLTPGTTVNATVVAKVNLANQTADINQTVAYAVPTQAAGRYRLACYLVLTTQATTSSTLPSCWVFWNDQDTSVAAVGNGNSSIGVGSNPSTSNALAQTNFALAYANSNSVTVGVMGGSTISFGTTGYLSSGATPMAFALHLTIEYLGP